MGGGHRGSLGEVAIAGSGSPSNSYRLATFFSHHLDLSMEIATCLWTLGDFQRLNLYTYAICISDLSTCRAESEFLVVRCEGLVITGYRLVLFSPSESFSGCFLLCGLGAYIGGR